MVLATASGVNVERRGFPPVSPNHQGPFARLGIGRNPGGVTHARWRRPSPEVCVTVYGRPSSRYDRSRGRSAATVLADQLQEQVVLGVGVALVLTKTLRLFNPDLGSAVSPPLRLARQVFVDSVLPQEPLASGWHDTRASAA